jgi:hypothetical protein
MMRSVTAQTMPEERVGGRTSNLGMQPTAYGRG